MSDKAVGSGKVSAAQVAQFVFDAIDERPLLHLQPPEGAGQRADAARGRGAGRNPTDPFAGKPEIGAELRADAARAG